MTLMKAVWGQGHGRERSVTGRWFNGNALRALGQMPNCPREYAVVRLDSGLSEREIGLEPRS